MDKILRGQPTLATPNDQPQDVMDAVQAMRQKAQSAGNLKNTPQQTVSQQPDGPIVIAPANPTVVYIPVYNPWAVYGAPVVVYPGFYSGPPPGISGWTRGNGLWRGPRHWPLCPYGWVGTLGSRLGVRALAIAER